MQAMFAQYMWCVHQESERAKSNHATQLRCQEQNMAFSNCFNFMDRRVSRRNVFPKTSSTTYIDKSAIHIIPWKTWAIERDDDATPQSQEVWTEKRVIDGSTSIIQICIIYTLWQRDKASKRGGKAQVSRPKKNAEPHRFICQAEAEVVFEFLP